MVGVLEPSHRLQHLDAGGIRGQRCECAQCLRLPIAGDGAVGVLAGHERKGLGLVLHQVFEHLHGLGMAPQAHRPSGGQHARTRGVRRDLSGVVQVLPGFLVVTARLRLERALAGVVRQASRVGPGATGFELLADGHGGRPGARAFVQAEAALERFGVERRALQGLEGGFRAVEQTGLEEVQRQRVLRAFAVGLSQIGAAQQVLVHPHGALELTPAAEQTAEREVQVDGVRVLLHGLDEGVDRLVLLL